MSIKSNFETRIANRAKSIFAAFGQVVNDFYLEAGIYFVGGFNASLVAWGIYTDLLIANQPLPYAVAVAVVAFVAVEGLAVYLVGAAAKTNSGLLWVFSVVFAAFFTYAHYQEMARPGIISQYITLAIPFFVVIGYYAKTIKVDTENGNDHKDQAAKDEMTRKRQLADEELAISREQDRLNAAHQRQIEQDRLNAAHQKEKDQQAANSEAAEHKRHMAEQAAELKHALALAKIEAKKVSNEPARTGQNGDLDGSFAANDTEMNRKMNLLTLANETRKLNKNDRLDRIQDLIEDHTQPEIADILEVSLSTVKRDVKELNGNLRKVK